MGRFLTTLTGISLALLLSNSEIILRISSSEQSSRNIEFSLCLSRYCSKELNLLSVMFWSARLSLRSEAIELKYLLNSLLITRLLVIFSLSMTNEGLIVPLVLPLSSLIIFQVFLRSFLFSTTLLQSYEFFAEFIIRFSAFL